MARGRSLKFVVQGHIAEPKDPGRCGPHHVLALLHRVLQGTSVVGVHIECNRYSSNQSSILPHEFTHSLTHSFIRLLSCSIINSFVCLDYTDQLIKNLQIGLDDQGNDGDIPLMRGFAKKLIFWKMLMLSGFLGFIVGIIGVLFMNVVEKIPEEWVYVDIDDINNIGYYKGKIFYIYVTAGTGLAVGIHSLCTHLLLQC